MLHKGCIGRVLLHVANNDSAHLSLTLYIPQLKDSAEQRSGMTKRDMESIGGQSPIQGLLTIRCVFILELVSIQWQVGLVMKVESGEMWCMMGALH